MQLKEFCLLYSSFTGTTLQIETKRAELVNQTKTLEFIGIIYDVKSDKILINSVLNELNSIDSSINFSSQITVL